MKGLSPTQRTLRQLRQEGRICGICENKISQNKRGPCRIYCSLKCKAKSRFIKYGWRCKYQKQCLYCQKMFHPYRTWQKSCSRFCGVRIRNGKTKRNKRIIYCKQCKVGYEKSESDISKSKFCSRFCQIKYRCENGLNSMNKNPNWKGGKSREPYSIFFNDKLKEQIRSKCKRVCQFCGIKEKENGRKLDVHHIDYNKQNSNPDNLITLCRGCNTRANYYGREAWTMAFRELKRWNEEGYYKMKNKGYVKI